MTSLWQPNRDGWLPLQLMKQSRSPTGQCSEGGVTVRLAHEVSSECVTIGVGLYTTVFEQEVSRKTNVVSDYSAYHCNEILVVPFMWEEQWSFIVKMCVPYSLQAARIVGAK